MKIYDLLITNLMFNAFTLLKNEQYHTANVFMCRRNSGLSWLSTEHKKETCFQHSTARLHTRAVEQL